MTKVPEGVDDLTPEWLSAALRLPVAAVSIEPIGSGQTGKSFRLSLAYEREMAGAPATLVAKLPGGDLDARRRVALGYRKEHGFYTHLATTVAVRTPVCWYGDLSDDATSFVLLLEDAAPRQPGVQVAGCDLAQARAAVRNLAALHAPRWNDEGLLEHAFLAPADETSAGYLGDYYRWAAVGFLDRYGDRLDDHDVRTIHDVGEAVVAWQLARPEPFAIVHGDYRLDNLMFPPDGVDLIAVDWQTVVVGPPLRDVAYFLGTALVPEVRRQEERSLVHAYADALLEWKVAYPFDACFEDYRLGQMQGPFITVIGAFLATAATSDGADEMFLSMVRRSCVAIRDLASLDLL